jgi:hypothetical protein
MVDVAPQGETLAALAEVATEADALGVTGDEETTAQPVGAPSETSKLGSRRAGAR